MVVISRVCQRENSPLNLPKTFSSWSGFRDELLWSAAWLYRATGKPHYRDQGYIRWWTEFGLNYRPNEATSSSSSVFS